MTTKSAKLPAPKKAPAASPVAAIPRLVWDLRKGKRIVEHAPNATPELLGLLSRKERVFATRDGVWKLERFQIQDGTLTVRVMVKVI